MNFQIQVIQVDKTTKPTKSGSYVQTEVAFKNLTSGKLESKKLMSFTQPDKAFKTMSDAKAGDVFTITSEKNDKTGYWDWLDAVQAAPGTVVEVNPKTNMSVGTASPKSTYETPEERAKKQVYIVRQSSLSTAVAVLSIGAKTPPSADAVISLAQQFSDYVFGVDKTNNPEAFLSLAEMANDIPLD